MDKLFKTIKSSAGLGDVPGFEVSGVSCDIRNKGNDRLDLALIYSALPCTAAGVFTQNRFTAAPVTLCQNNLKTEKPIHGIVVNSGNANACTGTIGERDAKAMQQLSEKALGIKRGTMLVASTGRIGEVLPMDKVAKGIHEASLMKSTTRQQSWAGADAILTSDTRRKVMTVEIPTSAGPIRIAGMAKGAGMIEPNMATMLAFIATDAKISTRVLKELLHEAVSGSFNAITVDGDMSTNDSVIVLANGLSKIAVTKKDKDLYNSFLQGLKALCYDLASKIVGDGEKITKVVEIQIDGAKKSEDAEKVARAIGNSLLVKSSWYGNDPNWGRLLDAAGYAGVDFNPRKVALYYQATDKTKPVPVFVHDEVLSKNKPKWKKIVLRKQFRILLSIGSGKRGYQLLATDLTEGYVNFNKSE